MQAATPDPVWRRRTQIKRWYDPTSLLHLSRARASSSQRWAAERVNPPRVFVVHADLDAIARLQPFGLIRSLALADQTLARRLAAGGMETIAGWPATSVTTRRGWPRPQVPLEPGHARCPLRADRSGPQRPGWWRRRQSPSGLETDGTPRLRRSARPVGERARTHAAALLFGTGPIRPHRAERSAHREHAIRSSARCRVPRLRARTSPA